ncbi:MAG: tol-pal system protein YbgF [Pseudomonadota bacterium]|jgi:tol-pal system protein YbgF|nr:tol-pal system protein YbgF [Pseudomonadota bacterium]
MIRSSCLALTALFVLGIPQTADAQRQRAQVVQGVTSGELALTVEEMRASNAELRARMTGIESDKAQLNGKVETLEFLLSQSRDEINRMQSDDAELERLISRLERRLSDQEKTIADLNRKLAALQPEPAFLAASGTMASTGSDEDRANEAEEETVEIAASGPTRIVRRTETAPEAQPAADTITQTGPDGEPLPQGSLGSLPASSLPGEAGPLFGEAKSRLLQFDYAGAEAAFRSFLSQFGDDPQAGEAQYWLAEVLYQQEAYAESGAAYTDMIRSYPDDPRAPEALAKLARSMRLVGDTDQACNALNLLPQRYPNASGVTRNLAAGERVRSGCDNS